ncbi:hypothetical protein BGX33_012217 [Mortierella sp. NVP41]|nr:hypothetical protein BGX33_012217 [Mortierella sp. NVP41]
MTTILPSQSPVDAVSNPSHTFMDNKPPLLPRQSTSDVLSFTQIIADRLVPGQTVWEYFSPAPAAAAAPPAASASSGTSDYSQSPTKSTAGTSGQGSPALSLSPTSPTTSSFSFFGSKRQSIIVDTNSRPPLPSPPQSASPTSATLADPASTAAAVDALSNGVVTPKIQKRKSFAQSLRNMLSLSQLLNSSSNSTTSASSKPTQSTGPPHYNILVLGSDSAPLASTLYKMSSLLPATNKIAHYQEISGFFVAYFRSNGSFTCSPKSSTELSDNERERRRLSRGSFRVADKDADDEVKSRGGSRPGMEEIDQDVNEEGAPSAPGGKTAVQRSSEESEATLLNSRLRHSKDRSYSSASSSATFGEGYLEDGDRAEEATFCQEPIAIDASSPANASLSVHAFSLDTTWPVPRMLAQTFWFPHAHGIIYIVDATRKNDPRGMDHLLNARQFLSSLIADPHFKRRDIPVVVFANKAGLDDETCFRVDEIADILGCEEWDDEGRISIQSGTDSSAIGGGSPSVVPPTPTHTIVGSAAARPWCVKSTRSDGEGDGLRESVEWLKSRMGEIWKV